MFTIPAKLYKKFGFFLVVPVLLLTVAGGFLIHSLSFRSGFTLFLPDDDPYRLLEERIGESFSRDNLTIVALDVDSLVDPDDLRRIERLVESALSIEGTEAVVSLTNLQDLFVEDGGLEQRRLYSPADDPDGTRLTERVLSTPLFRELFVSKDRQALYTYVIPATGVIPAEYGERLIGELDAPDVHFFGDAIAKAYVSRAVVSELAFLGALALAVVLIVEIIISKSLLIGALLSTASMVPAFWTLAFYPLLGSAVETTTMMVPVIVLVIATSYGIHIFRYHALGYGDMVETLEHVGQIVIAAGFTTMIGFLSLLVTPSRILTQLGILIIFGIFSALVTSLLLLPPILDLLTRRLRRRVGKNRSGRYVSLRDTSRGVGGKILRRLEQPPQRPVFRLVVFGVIIVGLAAFIPTVKAGYSARDTFRENTEISKTVSYFETRAGATHDLEIYADTGEQYGLVDMSVYERLRELDRKLESNESVARSISYIDFVEFMIGRLYGRMEPVRPENEAEIGEAMDMLSGGGVGLSFAALVDAEWGETRFLLQADFPSITDPDGVRAIEEFLRETRSLLGSSTPLRDARGERIISFEPEGFVTGAVLGMPIESLQHITYLSRSQVISLLVFAPVIIGFLMVVFRSVPWALLSLVPTVTGIAVYFGLLGLSGFLHDPIHVFMVAALMGISNDDVLYFVLVFRRESKKKNYAPALHETMHKTGAAIIQTTLIIVAGITVFYFSRFILLGRGGLVLTLALVASTATTLLILPSILALRRNLVVPDN